MQKFQYTFETNKPSFICVFSICMTVPLRRIKTLKNENYIKNINIKTLKNVKFFILVVRL